MVISAKHLRVATPEVSHDQTSDASGRTSSPSGLRPLIRRHSPDLFSELEHFPLFQSDQFFPLREELGVSFVEVTSLLLVDDLQRILRIVRNR
jgi:hypothetical protein